MKFTQFYKNFEKYDFFGKNIIISVKKKFSIFFEKVEKYLVFFNKIIVIPVKRKLYIF